MGRRDRHFLVAIVYDRMTVRDTVFVTVFSPESVCSVDKKAVWKPKYPCYFSIGGQKRYLSSSLRAENMLKQGFFEGKLS